METLTLTVPLQIKALNNRQISGHGSIFGNVDLGGDVVVRGAFAETLAEHKAAGTMPQMFWMHQWEMVAGRWDAMSEDDTGLAVEGTLAKTQLGDEIRELAKMKAVRGLSIGYLPKKDGIEWRDDGIRLLKSLELFEVSPVSLAMNPLAMIEHAKARLSATGEYVPTRREFEHKLRDAGLSHTSAKRIISFAFEDTPARDAPGRESEGIAEIIELCGKVATDSLVASIAELTQEI